MARKYFSIGILLSIAALALPIPGWPALGSEKTSGAREKLLGAWRLAYVEEPGADGKLVRTQRAGTLTYSADGRMAVQIVAPVGAPAESGPVKYEACNYESYFGAYTLDEAAGTVIHHAEGALVRSLIGQKLGRAFRFSGKQLILKSTRADEHWTIAWERY